MGVHCVQPASGIRQRRNPAQPVGSQSASGWLVRCGGLFEASCNTELTLPNSRKNT